MSKRLTSSFAALGFALISHSSPARSEQEFTDLVAKVMPSVVNIAIEAKGQRVKLEQSAGDLEYATYVVEYVGAGSIVDPSGLIITNRHVVKDAYEIDVTLSDGATYKGELLGAGSGTDLAILKIDVGRPLPAIEIGNSDDVKVGERVIAIGNPLGLASSVSAGRRSCSCLRYRPPARARAGATARVASIAGALGWRARWIHLLASITIGSAKARPIQASHCMPVSSWVSRPRCRKPISVANTRSTTGTTEMAAACRIGGVSPLAGSRRLVSALKTVPRPITTNVIVIEALGRSGLGLVGPDDERCQRGEEEHHGVQQPRTGSPCGW